MSTLTAQTVLSKCKVEDLSQAKNLNLWGMDLSDISVVAKCVNLEVLALSVNKISTCKPLTECKKLKELYLRKNDIKDLREVFYLRHLPELSVLWLVDNPCASHPNYRIFTIACCPKLKQFDNVAVTPQELAEAKKLTTADLDTMARGAGTSAPPPSAKQVHPAIAPHVVNVNLQNIENQNVRPPSSSRQTQKNILSAILTLMNELNPESMNFLQHEINGRLGKK